MEEKQYYRILGIPRDANLKDIKKAYQALSKKYSPGKNPGNEDWAEKRKLDVVEAYDILSNPETRAQYDEKSKIQVITPAPIINIKNSTLPVRPARRRVAPQNKKSRTDEKEGESKLQKEREAKNRRRNTILTISGIVSIVLVVVLVFYLITYVLPFQKPIATVDGESVTMGYFIRRVMMASSSSTSTATNSDWTTLQSVINEILVTHDAPNHVNTVTEAEIDQFMRTTAQGDATSITDVEYANWLRQELNLSQLTEKQFRDLFKSQLYQTRMYNYLSANVSDTVPQVHMYYILVTTYDEALAAKARIDAGEDFAIVAKEVSTDATKTNGGDVGWSPPTLLSASVQTAITNLEIGKCSEPIAMTSSSDTSSTDASSYALVMISEKSDAMVVTSDQLAGLKSVAYNTWLEQLQSAKSITFHGIHNKYLDTETFTWVDYQVARLQKGLATTTTTETTTSATTAGGQ